MVGEAVRGGHTADTAVQLVDSVQNDQADLPKAFSKLFVMGPSGDLGPSKGRPVRRFLRE